MSRTLSLHLCLLALIACGDDASSDSTDGGGCPDISGTWTIERHCQADLVGDEVMVAQDGCAFSDETFGYTGTVSANGTVTAELERSGTDPIRCTGSATATTLTETCTGITPPCEVRLRR